MREIIQQVSKTAKPRKQNLEDASVHVCVAASQQEASPLHCSLFPISQIVYLYVPSRVILTKS